LIDLLASTEPEVLNPVLRLLAIAHSESENAREILEQSDLFGRISALPGFASLEVGELVVSVIQKSSTEQFCGLLPSLLASPIPANIAHALRCVEWLMAEGVEIDFGPIERELPGLIMGEPEVSAAAFLVLPAEPVTSSAYFGAVLGALANGSAHSVNYLMRTRGTWGIAPPAGALAAVVAGIRELPYAKGRAALPLIGAALRGEDEESVVAEAAQAAVAFVGDDAAEGDAIAALLEIWERRVNPQGGAEWFTEVIRVIADVLDSGEMHSGDSAKRLLGAL
jgi:hypothetical protein